MEFVIELTRCVPGHRIVYKARLSLSSEFWDLDLWFLERPV